MVGISSIEMPVYKLGASFSISGCRCYGFIDQLLMLYRNGIASFNVVFTVSCPFSLTNVGTLPVLITVICLRTKYSSSSSPLLLSSSPHIVLWELQSDPIIKGSEYSPGLFPSLPSVISVSSHWLAVRLSVYFKLPTRVLNKDKKSGELYPTRI